MPRLTEAEYAALLERARATNAERDEEEQAAGGMSMDRTPLSEVLRIVQAAIMVGVTTGDLDPLAEAHALLDDAAERLRRNPARVAAQEVAWAHRDRRSASRRRGSVSPKT